MSDPQDVAEALDMDKLGGEFPPDEPLGVEDGTADDSITESFEGRESRLVPEDEPVISTRSEPLDGGNRVSPQDEDAQVPAPAEEATLHLEEP
ncbi:MAG: hypothetical protein Q8K58_05775 [Acidimicrobiales bacterium]|nr:hypothetical protein [Acidimicrobiales bacterium]